MKHVILYITLMFICETVMSQNRPVQIESRDLKSIEEINFYANTNNYKKIFKKWGRYPQIYKVKIDSDVDSALFYEIIKEVSKNKNIEELTLTLTNEKTSVLTLFDLSHIKTLKIIRSNQLKQIELLKAQKLLNQLSSFSWNNNQQILELSILNELKQLKTLELIDTHLNIIDDTLANQLSKMSQLKNLAISYTNKSMLCDLSSLKSLNQLLFINIEPYKVNSNTTDLLNPFELNHHTLLSNKTGLSILYLNNEEFCNNLEKAFIINQFSLNELFYKSPQKIKNNLRPEANKFSQQSSSDTTNPIEIKEYFKNPIKSLKIEPLYLSINNNKDTVLKFDNGTNISIPKNCFINKKGENIESGISIYYREFTNPISIFASGIPMITSIDGKKETLTSGGMFEIKAFNGNEELQIKSGQKIDIEFASIDDNKRYNFYEFDTSINEWVDLKKDLVTLPLENNIIESNQVINSRLFNPLPEIYYPQTVDTTSFENRYDNFEYYFLCDKEFQKRRVQYLNGRYYGEKRVKNFSFYNTSFSRKKNLVKFISVPREKGDSITSLRLKFNYPQMQLYFPELINFNNTTFYHKDFSKYRKFKEQFLKNKIYSDVRIEYEKNNDYCVLILKEKQEFIRIELHLFDESISNLKKQNLIRRNFYKSYIKYNRKLNERSYNFNKKLEVDYRTSLRNYPKSTIDINNDSNLNKTILWLKPVNAKRRAELVKTGLYNLDVKYEYVKSKIYALTLNRINQESISFNCIYVFDENANTYFKYESQNVVLQPETLMGIIATTSKGEIYYINKNDIPNINFSSEKVSIIMNEPNFEVDTLSNAIKLFISK